MSVKAKTAWKAFTEAQTVWGLLPGAFTSSLIALSGYIAGFGAPKIGLYALFSWGLVEFILWRATSRNSRAFALAILGFGTFSVLFFSYQQSLKESGNFKLKLNGYDLFRGGRRLPSGEGKVEYVNFVVSIKNDNNFPIFYRVDRRYVSLYGKSTNLTVIEPEVEELQPHFSADITANSIDKELENGKTHEGEYDYLIYYGRSEKNLDHRFSDSGRFVFFLCPQNGRLCGPVGSKGSKAKNEIVSETKLVE